MKNKIMKRAFSGFWQGAVICYFLSIAASFQIGDGSYYSCDPDLISAVGTEIGAVALQFVLAGLLGAAFAGFTFIWLIVWLWKYLVLRAKIKKINAKYQK